MSFIACTSDCVYQKDGCCSLERAASGQEIGLKNNRDGFKANTCIHFVESTNVKKQK